MIAKNIDSVRRSVHEACMKAGRDPKSVEIMGVTKFVGPDLIREAVSYGIVSLGENQVQEIRRKKALGAYDGARLCLIGHLQTNKASMAARVCDEVHSVDSVRVAEALSKFSLMYRTDGVLPVLMEVNAGRDPKKHGVLPEDASKLCDTIMSLEGIQLRGLMTVAPEDPTLARGAFRSLRLLRDELAARGTPVSNLETLSMGMSQDYESAILEGSTMVRIGTALFGPRAY